VFQGVGWVWGTEASVGLLHFANTASGFYNECGSTQSMAVGEVRQREGDRRGV